MGKYFDVSYMIQAFPQLLNYVHVTVLITVISAILGVILGSIIAIIRLKKVPVLNQLFIVFISFMRGTPFLVQLFLIYFGVPEIMSHMGLNMKNVPGLVFVYAVFTLHIGAYSAEIMRSSIDAVSPGEKEAAKCLGMTEFQSYVRIILPQAFTMSIPPLTNLVIGMLKGTALIFNVGVVDMMRKADLMGGNSQRYLELFVDAAIIYGILIIIVSLLGRLLEKRFTVAGKETQRILISEEYGHMGHIIDSTYIYGTFFAVIPYVKVTLMITFLSVGLGTILGLLSCVLQQNKVPVLSQLSYLYVLLCRSIPNMVLLYLVYYGLPILFLALEDQTGVHVPFEKVPATFVAVVGLTLHTGAYLSEIFRAALQSVPKGQMEAAQAIGMTWFQAFRRIVLPQATVFALPLFTNQFLNTMKSTSIVFVITVIELFGAAKLYTEENSQYFEAYIVVAGLFWVMGIVFEFIFHRLEIYASKYKRGNAL